MPRSALALAALATTAVPGLDAVATTDPQRVTADLQLTGVLDAAGRRWVVRCPRHPAASAQFEGERALLRALNEAVEDGRLPFEVVRCAGTAALPEGGHLMVSPMLRGRPLDLDALRPGPGLAASLGAALAALHELDPSVVADVGLPVYTADTYRRRCLAEVDEAARTGRVPSVLLNRWERALEDVTLWRFRATPVHADLAPEQVLVAEEKVTGILSFGEAHVGDPAEDLAWLMASAPEESLDSIIEAYVMGRSGGTDSALLDRAMLTSELALARWLLHGVRSGDEGVVEDAVEMLQELAEDVLNAPPIGYHEPTVAAGAWSTEDDGWEAGSSVTDAAQDAAALDDAGQDEDDADHAVEVEIVDEAASRDDSLGPTHETSHEEARHAAEQRRAEARARRGVTEPLDLDSLREDTGR